MDVNTHTPILEQEVLDICTNLSIYNHYHFVKTNNPSKDLPYHNWYHALCVVKSCYNGAQHYNLSMPVMRALCVAALWHDYGHSGGKHADSYNIIAANRAYLNFHLSLVSSETRDYDSDLAHVPGIIRITEYPYVNSPVSIEQKIMRDADLMQITYPTWYEMCIRRLGDEISVSRGRTVTELEMVEGQIEFLQNTKMCTGWGNDASAYSKIVNISNLINRKEALQGDAAGE